MSDFAWRPIKAKDIVVGNLVSSFTATRPRHITKILVVNEKITLYENDDFRIYLNEVDQNHPIDLLINCKTLKPATFEEINHE